MADVPLIWQLGKLLISIGLVRYSQKPRAWQSWERPTKPQTATLSRPGVRLPMARKSPSGHHVLRYSCSTRCPRCQRLTVTQKPMPGPIAGCATVHLQMPTMHSKRYLLICNPHWKYRFKPPGRISKGCAWCEKECLALASPALGCKPTGWPAIQQTLTTSGRNITLIG